MKIEDMVKREDFYGILKSTLKFYFDSIGKAVKLDKAQKSSKGDLFVYEKLNAATTKKPSKTVRNFLYAEYCLRGNTLKRCLVKMYLYLVFHTGGLFAKKAFVVSDDKVIRENALIYPCSKKIRIFYFDLGVVDVVAKEKFENYSIKKEVEFRKRYGGDHVPKILFYKERWYREEIIDGKPLARVVKAKEYEEAKKESMKILCNMTSEWRHVVNSKDYINETVTKVNTKTFLLLRNKPLCKKMMHKAIDYIKKELITFKKDITLTLSHGDFHHGNIWIENSTRRIIFIDWETYEIRSQWYDPVTLFGGLREIKGIERLLDNAVNDRILSYIECDNPNEMRSIIFMVILEDVLFRLTEVESFPFEIGVYEFERYCLNLYNALVKAYRVS